MQFSMAAIWKWGEHVPKMKTPIYSFIDMCVCVCSLCVSNVISLLIFSCRGFTMPIALFTYIYIYVHIYIYNIQDICNTQANMPSTLDQQDPKEQTAWRNGPPENMKVEWDYHLVSNKNNEATSHRYPQSSVVSLPKSLVNPPQAGCLFLL